MSGLDQSLFTAVGSASSCYNVVARFFAIYWMWSSLGQGTFFIGRTEPAVHILPVSSLGSKGRRRQDLLIVIRLERQESRTRPTSVLDGTESSPANSFRSSRRTRVPSPITYVPLPIHTLPSIHLPSIPAASSCPRRWRQLKGMQQAILQPPKLMSLFLPYHGHFHIPSSFSISIPPVLFANCKTGGGASHKIEALVVSWFLLVRCGSRSPIPHTPPLSHPRSPVPSPPFPELSYIKPEQRNAKTNVYSLSLALNQKTKTTHAKHPSLPS